MSVLFTVPVPPNGVVLHVLQIRNRTAFLARELGLAAGASDEAQGFIHHIIHEWGASLDEDDDIAEITGVELDVLKREVPLPADTTMELVLFATGAERVLFRSRLRYARSLILFLHAEVLSRVLTLHSHSDDGGQNGAASPGQAGTPKSAPSFAQPGDDAQAVPAEGCEPISRREFAFAAIGKLANELYALDLLEDDEYRSLRVEAVEELLGRRLRTRLPAVADLDDAPLAS